MKDNTIGVYYHIWAPDNTDMWKLMVDEQLKRLYKSGLTDNSTVYCCINGVQADRIIEFVKLYDFVNVLQHRSTDDEYEGFTLKHLYEHSLSDIHEYVLYFHTKGISHLCGSRDVYSDRRFRAINSWRHLMEWGCVDKWKDNIQKLNHYQVSGVNYCLDPWPHMSGNFWWARSDYVKTLIHPTKDAFPGDSRDFGPIQRMNFEKWIGLNDPFVYSFYNPPFSYDHKNLIPDVVPTPPGEPHWFWLYRDDIFPYYLKEDLTNE